MNGLPVKVKFDQLLENELTQICFGTFQFILNFEGSVQIAVESICVYESASGVLDEIQNYSEGASQLCQLIGDKVLSAERDVEGGLILSFKSGAKLQIKNSNKDYESFQIHLGQQTYVA